MIAPYQAEAAICELLNSTDGKVRPHIVGDLARSYGYALPLNGVQTGKRARSKWVIVDGGKSKSKRANS